MAVAYDAFLQDLLPFARNCPDPVIEAAIRAAVIEFCEKTEIWQVELDPVSAVAGQYAYDLEAPQGSAVRRILTITDEQGYALEPVTSGMLDQRSPNWREVPGRPTFYIKRDEELQIWLAPPPATARVNAYLIRAVLVPTITSTSCSNVVMNNFRDTIVNGAIARLLSMPDKDWSNFKTAAVHFGLFRDQLVEAEKYARQANEGATPVTRYGGIGPRYRGKDDYGNRRTRSW